MLKGLYAITDTEAFNQFGVENTINQLIEGDAQVIQFRDKLNSHSTRKSQCLLIQEICSQSGTTFIINDDVKLAKEVNADGVHLGKNDCSVANAREQLGSDKIIGLSCYNQLNLAINAQKDCADYIAFGSFFPSQTKPDANSVSIAFLEQATSQLSIPICAIGGITYANAKILVKAGADLVAVITDLYRSEHIKSNALALSKIFYPKGIAL